MLTTSPQILKKLQSYRERNLFSYSEDFQTIILNCKLSAEWINDDEFFRNIFFGGPDLNSPITLCLNGESAHVIDVMLESRSIPNITHYLWTLGYKPCIYTSLRIGRVKDLQLLSVDVVKEPVNDACKIAELLDPKNVLTNVEYDMRDDEIFGVSIVNPDTQLSTSQPKTNKKRK